MFVGVALPLGVVVLGALAGVGYALFGMGLTLTYQSSRVINFARGAMGAVPHLMVMWLVIDHGVGYWPALLLAVTVAVGSGHLLEVGSALQIVRETIQLAGTALNDDTFRKRLYSIRNFNTGACPSVSYRPGKVAGGDTWYTAQCRKARWPPTVLYWGKPDWLKPAVGGPRFKTMGKPLRGRHLLRVQGRLRVAGPRSDVGGS